jgi:hypothetical protein
MSKRMATKAPSHEEYTKGKGISNIEQGISNDEVVLVGETILLQSFLRLKDEEYSMSNFQ